MLTKLKHPTKISEVKEYDLKIARYLFDMLNKRIHVSLDGITEEELFDPSYKSKSVATESPLTKENLADAKRMAKTGKIPGSILDLPPVLFNSSSDVKSAVPYLNVRAVSWLNTDKPKALYHSLLSLVRENNSNEN